MEVRPRTSETRRPGCALLALLAAAGLAYGCGNGSDGASTKPEDGGSSVAADPGSPDPIADPVEAFVELARAEGADERDLAIARCTIEQVQEYNGRSVAELMVRAKRAQIAKQPMPQEAMPALGILLQEANECTRKHDGESGKQG